MEASTDLDLLELHKPVLRYDRQYDYRVSSVAGMVENAGNLLRSAHGEVIASVGGDPLVTLDLLGAYPDERTVHERDCLVQAPNVLGDARRMEADPKYAGVIYGRVVPGRGGRLWLQYWWWLYYNPKNLFGFGKHEGDWEMIQVGLGPDGEPEAVAYAQHASGEARKPKDMEWVERDGGRHPVVYVAPLSHASYFESGTHPYPVGIDHPYGDGPEAWLPVEPFGSWNDWPGYWGSQDHVIAGKLGNPPRSPAHQGGKWKDPAAFQRKMKRRKLRSTIGRLAHRLGGQFYPLPPELSARFDGKRCTIDYRVRQTPRRRSRHLYLSVHDGERVLATRAVRCSGDSGTETLRLTEEPQHPEVWGSTFNKVRQRSDLTRATLTDTPT